MSKTILRVDSSIKGDGSVSRKLTDDILARLTAENAGATVVSRDLASLTPPMIDGSWLGAVFTPAADRNADQAKVADLSDTLIREVKEADVLLLGMPIYNFAIPAQLKAWIDQLCRAGETFKYTEEGPVGLIEGTRAIVVMTSDGTHLGSEIDFATPYIKHILGFIGITDVQFVTATGLAFDKDGALKAANDAVAKIDVAA